MAVSYQLVVMMTNVDTMNLVNVVLLTVVMVTVFVEHQLSIVNTIRVGLKILVY